MSVVEAFSSTKIISRQSMFYSMLKEAKAEQQAVLRRRMSIQANDA